MPLCYLRRRPPALRFLRIASGEDQRAERANGTGMTAPQWTPEIVVDAALAKRLIETQFPEFRGAPVERSGAGWDNAAFLVDGRMLFRFPQRTLSAPLIARELAVLPLLAPELPVPIPVPAFAGVAGEGYPWTFAGYALLPGAPADERVLSDEERLRLADPLARFLRALHRIPVAPLVAHGLPPDELGRLDHQRRMRPHRERMAFLADRRIAHLDALGSWLEAHPPRAIADAARTCVHGDLYARHLLLDERGDLAGIIDWGDIHLGDPALDLAIAHLVLPASAHERFRRTYGPIDDDTWTTARYRAIYHAIVELDYGIREHDAGMRESGSAALALIAAGARLLAG